MTLQSHIQIAAAGIALALSGCSTGSTNAVPSVAALLSDPIRPSADVARDADRKPVELLQFAGVRRGLKVVELAPGGGYFTRILTGAVGPQGRVYAIAGRASPVLQELAAKRSNLTVVVASPGTVPVPEQVDLVWTTLNYHDFKNVRLPNGDAAQALNAEVFRVLKPGGTYLIVDHEAATGAGATQTSTLHRIESTVVRREVGAAGFVLDAESSLLRHPADEHTTKVQEAGIRGKTDQFILKFRKPR